MKNHRLKILHVIPSVGPLRGGPSVMIRLLTRGLVDAGVDAHVAATDDNGRDRLSVRHETPMVEAGVTHWYFDRQTRFYSFSWPLSRWLARHVQDYDLIHIHALFSYAAIPAAFWASRGGVPYIVRPLGTLNRWGMQNRRPQLKRFSFHCIERRILAGAAAVHYTSDQERREAAELGVVKGAVVIPNAIDTAIASSGQAGRFRARYPQLAGRDIILFLSRLDPKKGLDLLLPAFAQVRSRYPRVALVLAGNGDPAFVADLQSEARRLGIDSDTLWTGFLAGEERWAALADADIFVLPSYSENFGIAAVEAMAFGLPLVISDQMGVYPTVAAAQAGLVVPCRVEAIRQALIRLVGNARLRSELAGNARGLAQKEFSLGAVTRRLIDLYSALIDNPAKRAAS